MVNGQRGLLEAVDDRHYTAPERSVPVMIGGTKLIWP